MELSVVIPTFNEGNNVCLLAEKIKNILHPLNQSFELIFVDDSLDDTPDLLAELAKKEKFVRYFHREGKRGLATAVLDGIERAGGEVIVVMDADLQHPPCLIPDMIQKLEEGYQMVIPSRFVKGGDDGGLNAYRKFVSWSARMMARFALKRIRKITDPTSGFFAVRKNAIEGKSFEPIGWKILLELIVRADIQDIAEIPYHFKARDLGSSKLNAKEQFRYLVHLIKLASFSEEDSRFFKFCLVGLSGVVVNTSLFRLFEFAHLEVYLAFFFASVLSMFSNFLLNNFFTWRTGYSNDFLPFSKRLIKYITVSSGGIVISSLIVSLFFYIFHVPSIISGFIGIVAGVLWNFVLNDKWTFSKKRRKSLIGEKKKEHPLNL